MYLNEIKHNVVTKFNPPNPKCWPGQMDGTDENYNPFSILRMPVGYKNLITLHIRALEILKSESVQPMTMTSSMSPFPKKKKKYVYITCHEN